MGKNNKGRPVGAKSKIGQSIKEAIESAFRQKNGKRNAYLLKLADEQPAIFCALVAKCVPNQVALDVTVALDLGAAMLRAEQNVERLNVIEHDPIQDEPTRPLIIHRK